MSDNTENKQLEAIKQDNDNIVPGFGSKKGFELAQRAATLLSKSTLVPRQYQNNLPNCVIALNMATRMSADPLMVMQNLYIVNGRPAWSSQFLISTFNTSGRFSALRYEWVGEEGKDNWGCRAWAVEKETGEKLVGSPVTIGLAKKEGWFDRTGSKWQTMPAQMLMYRSAAWFIRAYAPELAMGMHTQDEIIDISPDEYEIIETEIRENANAEIIDVEPVEEPKPEPGPAPKAEPKQDTKKAAKAKGKNQDGLFAQAGPGF